MKMNAGPARCLTFGGPSLHRILACRDYWARFERFVKQLAGRCEALYVVTGPLYLPSLTPAGGFAMTYPLIGEPAPLQESAAQL